MMTKIMIWNKVGIIDFVVACGGQLRTLKGSGIKLVHCIMLNSSFEEWSGGVVGYHVSLTCSRSRVRSPARPLLLQSTSYPN